MFSDRHLHKTYNEEFAANDALAAATKAGVGVTEAQEAVKKAKANSEAAEKKLKVTSKPFQEAEANLEKIYQKINKAAEALEKCEKDCPKEKPAAGITFKPIPNCFDQAYLDDLDDQFQKINFPLSGETGLRRKLLNTDPSETGYTELKTKVDKAEEDLKAIKEQKKKAYEKWKMPCPDGSGMYFPGSAGDGQTYAVTFVDTGEDCKFGRSEPISTPLTPTDVNFNPIPRGDVVPPAGAATDTPKTPRVGQPPSSPTAEKPPASETPETPTDAPKTPKDTPKIPTASDKPPPDQLKTPDQQTTTETPPETPIRTTDAPPTDDVIILFKGNQSVLERDQTGDPLQRQHLMLVFKKPEHRESGTGQPAKDDSGFDKDGVQGVTGADGQAKLTVPAEDRELYLSSFGDAPKKYYRVDFNVMRNTGGVREIARNARPDLKSSGPKGGKVNAEIFKIGDRTFARRLYIAPFGVNVVLIAGEDIDWCRVVQPGPALGTEPEYPSALHRELPEATVKLPQAGRRGRYAR